MSMLRSKVFSPITPRSSTMSSYLSLSARPTAPPLSHIRLPPRSYPIPSPPKPQRPAPPFLHLPNTHSYPFQCHRAFATSTPPLFQRAHNTQTHPRILEAERKFVPTRDTLTTLRLISQTDTLEANDRDVPGEYIFSYKGLETVHDVYFDPVALPPLHAHPYSDPHLVPCESKGQTLMERGFYFRRRNGVWEVKRRHPSSRLSSALGEDPRFPTARHMAPVPQAESLCTEVSGVRDLCCVLGLLPIPGSGTDFGVGVGQGKEGEDENELWDRLVEYAGASVADFVTEREVFTAQKRSEVEGKEGHELGEDAEIFTIVLDTMDFADSFLVGEIELVRSISSSITPPSSVCGTPDSDENDRAILESMSKRIDEFMEEHVGIFGPQKGKVVGKLGKWFEWVAAGGQK